MVVAGLGLAFMVGCKDGKGGSGGENDSLVAPDTLYFDPVPECSDLKEKQFCWNGIDFISLGDSLTWKQYAPPVGGVFKDTVFSDTVQAEGGEAVKDWNVRLLRFASGTVFLEADFETGHLLNRVRLQTPEYKMKNGLGVGSAVAEIVKAYEGEQLYVLPFEEYGVMEIIRPVIVGESSRRIVFHVPLGDWYVAGKAEYVLADLPVGARVSQIVLM